MVTDDSETFRLDNLESEVIGGVCRAPDSCCLMLLRLHKRQHLALFPVSEPF